MKFVPHTRIGVAGYGYWGTKHVRVLSRIPGVDVTVIETDQRRLKQAATDHPGVRQAAALDEVLDSLDGVVVATPPGTHANLAMRALDAGLHALIEKPLATTEADGAAVVEAARLAGVRLMAGHVFEYNAAVWKLRDLVVSGELGRVLHIECSRLNLGRYQQDCNVIWDLAPHDLSIVGYLLDDVPETVSVWLHHAVETAHADVAHVRLDFPAAGVPVFLHLSWFAPEKVRRITVVGDKKTAVYDDLADTERIRVHDIGVDLAEHPVGQGTTERFSYRSGDIVSPHIPFAEPLVVQDTHFVECVRDGSAPFTPGEQGLEVVRVLAAADRATSSGAPAVVYREHVRDGLNLAHPTVEVGL